MFIAVPSHSSLSFVRVFIRFIGLLFFIVQGAFTVITRFHFADDRQKRAYKQRWARRIVAWLSMQVVGAEDLANNLPAGTLVVSNHISWLDIIVFNAIYPMSFVAKHEVRAWPIIGWLAHKNGTIFIERNNRRAAQRTVENIRAALIHGEVVAIFPSGTTYSGAEVGHFHSALFEVLRPNALAQNPTDIRLQPIAISYHDTIDDWLHHSSTPAYIGDTSLISSMWKIAAHTRLIARAQMASVIHPQAVSHPFNRRLLAKTTEERVRKLLSP